MLGRVGGAERGEKWTKKRENGAVSTSCCLLLLLTAEQSGGQARLGDVMWHLCVVSRSIYTTSRRRRHKESAATDNHTVIILSIHCPTATRPPTCPSYTPSSPAAPPSLQSMQPAQQSSNQVRLLCFPFHLPFRSCSFSCPDNNPLKDTSE